MKYVVIINVAMLSVGLSNNDKTNEKQIKTMKKTVHIL